MGNKIIEQFLDFERKAKVENILYKDRTIWPVIRNAIFHEILRERKILQQPNETQRKKSYDIKLTTLF